MAETQTDRKAPNDIPPAQARNGSTTEGDKPDGNEKESKDSAEKEDGTKKKPFKWTPLKIGLLIGIGVVLIVLGSIYLVNADNHATTDDAYTTGHLHFISSRVTGTVIGVLVDDNQFVKRGQVLVQLDPRDYQVKVEEARANYLKDKADNDRIMTVKGDGAISKQDYDQSDASLLIDQATLEDALDQLSYCTICAPTDGYVGNKAVELGNRVEIGGSLLEIVQDAWVLGNFKETQIGHMLPGQPLVIIPLLGVATAGLPKRQAGSASAIFNMMRNMGGSIGIALLSTLVTRREQFHSVRIGETVTALTPVVIARISSLDSLLLGKGLDPTTAHRTALTILNGEVQIQSFIMAYSESFLVVGVILFASCGAVLFLPTPAKLRAASVPA